MSAMTRVLSKVARESGRSVAILRPRTANGDELQAFALSDVAMRLANDRNQGQPVGRREDLSRPEWVELRRCRLSDRNIKLPPVSSLRSRYDAPGTKY